MSEAQVAARSEARRNRLAGVVRWSPVIAVFLFTGGLLYVFPNAFRMDCFPVLPCLVLAIFLVAFRRHQGRPGRLSFFTFVTPLMTMAALFVAFWGMDVFVLMRESAPRTMVANQLKQIVLALHAYHDKHGRLPPAVVRAKDGRPLYSWRALILPMLDEQALYDRFHLDEPWDSPHNIQLLDEVPAAYHPAPYLVAPASAMTFFQAVVGPGAGFEGDQGLDLKKDFPDGTDQTILVLEARTAVPWTKPADVVFSPEQPLPEFAAPRYNWLGRFPYGERIPYGFNAALANGSVQFFRTDLAPSTLRAWITRNGGERIDQE